MGIFAKTVLLLFATGLPVAMAAELGTPPGLHDRAVELARAGELDESLRILGLLREDSPDDSQLMYDQTVVFSWAGHDTEVLRNATFIDPETAPDYVLGPVAKAWRNSNDFESAEYWYSELLARDGSNQDARIGPRSKSLGCIGGCAGWLDYNLAAQAQFHGNFRVPAPNPPASEECAGSRHWAEML